MNLPRIARHGLLAAWLLLAGIASGQAHAVVTSSDPAAAATLPALPGAVTIRFNSRIDAARSRLVLVAPDGVQTPLELRTETEPTQLHASLPTSVAAAPGAWRLRWQVLAIDGHITRGDVPFSITGR